MIIVKLMGGLGNQMFQYALGRNLALKHNVALKLDVSALTDLTIKAEHTIRDLSLNAFNIKADVATADEIAGFQKTKFKKLLNYCYLYLPLKINNFYLREPFFHFFNKALIAPSNTYIDGYWQSECYFSAIRKQLTDDFTLIKPPSFKSLELEKRIRNTQSVSIHVRRGDYITIAANNKLYATCSQQYYYNAIEAIKNKYSNPALFVFSDEPEWFKATIKTDLPVNFIVHNLDQKNYEDIYLMSLCKHNIIANSTFSWWGAWLNQHENKTVIAPKNWFKNNSKVTTDLLPQSWIQL